MFFLSKDDFSKAVGQAVAKYVTSTGIKSLIDDSENYNGKYVERVFEIQPEQMWLMYLRNEWIRSCVDKIIRYVTNTNLKAVPADETLEEVPEEMEQRIDAINSLFADPNTGLESWKDIRREYMRDILIYDAGALEIVYDTEGLPAELYSLKGSKIRLNVNKHGSFKSEEEAYALLSEKGADKNEYLARKEVCYMVANPKSGSVYGISPLETLYIAVVSDLNASKYNSDFFKNHGEASGILGVEGLNDADIERFRAYWNKEIKGKAHKLAVASGKISWTPMNMSNRDMQFLEYQKWLLGKIMAVYSIQPIILGMIDITTGKLNSQEQMEAFREECIRPMLELETYQLTKTLVQLGFGWEDIKITYETIDTRDAIVDTNLATTLVQAGIITVNEARQQYLDMEKIEGGDTLASTAMGDPFGDMGLTEDIPSEQKETMGVEDAIEELSQQGVSQEQVKNLKGNLWVEKKEIVHRDVISKKIVRRGDKWCVVHAHPQKPGSTDKPIGTVIKCFPTRAQAVKMHQAITISQSQEE